jgi:acyl carrier protein
MNTQEIKTAVLSALARIAPEADLDALDPSVEFRDQLDIDSFDFLTLIIALHEATGVDIPEADYQQLATLNAAIAYLTTAPCEAVAG